MPILSRIGRKSPGTRALIAAIYAALGLGAAATLDVPPPAKKSKTRRKGAPAAAIDTSAAPANPVLFEALRAWRTEQAAAKKLPAYCIFSQKALCALAAAAPKTEAQLADIHGIGPKKLAQYGEALLDLVRQNA